MQRSHRLALLWSVSGALLLIVGFAVARARRNAGYRDQVDLAARLRRQGRVEEAAAQLDAVLAARPEDAEALFALSELEAAKGNAERSSELVRRVLDLAPDHGPAALARALELREQGRADEARALIDRAAADPRSAAPARWVRIQQFIDDGAPHAALEECLLAVGEFPDSAAVRLHAAQLAMFVDRLSWSTAHAQRIGELLADAARLARADGDGDRLRTALSLTGVEGPPSLSDTRALTAFRARMAERDSDIATLRQLSREADASRTSVEVDAALIRTLAAADRMGAAKTALEAARARWAGAVELEAARIPVALADAHRDSEIGLVLSALPVGYPPPAPLELELHVKLLTAPATTVDHDLRLALVGAFAAIDLAEGRDDSADVRNARESLAHVREPGAPVLTWDAVLALAAGDAEGAERITDRILKTAPEFGPALAVRSRARARLGRTAEALADARACVAADPGVAGRRALLVTALSESGEVREALYQGRTALDEYPGHARVVTAMLHALDLEGSPAAREERALLLAWRALDAGDSEGPERCSRELLARHPDSLGARALRREALRFEAERRERRALVEPDDLELRLDAARAAARSGDLESARRLLLGAPDDPGAACLLARTQLALDRPGAARATLTTALERFANDAGLEIESGLLRMHEGEEGSARASFARAFDTATESATKARAAALIAGDRGADDADVARVSAWADSGARTGSQDPFVVRALLRFREGRHADALDTLRQGVGDGVPRAEVSLTRARILADLGRLPEAEQALWAASARDPDNQEILDALAQLRMRMARTALAVGDRRRAVEAFAGAMCGRDADVEAGLALAILQAGESDSVVEDQFRRLRLLRPGSAGPYTYRGQTLRTRGEFDRAQPYLIEAFERAPTHVVCVAALVQNALATGALDSAEVAARRYIDAGDRYGTGSYLMGRVFTARGREMEARSAFDRALDADPGNTAAALRRIEVRPAGSDGAAGLALLDRKWAAGAGPTDRDRELARQVLAVEDDGLGSDPRFLAVLSAADAVARDAAIAEFLAEHGMESAAFDRLAAAIRGDPGRRAVYARYATLARRAARTGDALSWMRDWTATHPRCEGAHFALGNLLRAEGDAVAAVAAYRRALEIAPDFVEALNNLAWVLGVEIGRTQEAVRLCEMARTQRPSDPSIADTYGWLLHVGGDQRGSSRVLDEACAAAPQDAGIHLHRALVRMELLRWKEAAADLELVRTLDADFAESRGVDALLEKVRSAR